MALDWSTVFYLDCLKNNTHRRLFFGLTVLLVGSLYFNQFLTHSCLDRLWPCEMLNSFRNQLCWVIPRFIKNATFCAVSQWGHLDPQPTLGGGSQVVCIFKGYRVISPISSCRRLPASRPLTFAEPFHFIRRCLFKQSSVSKNLILILAVTAWLRVIIVPNVALLWLSKAVFSTKKLE